MSQQTGTIAFTAMGTFFIRLVAPVGRNRKRQIAAKTCVSFRVV
jgi:hypothetical protein